MGLGAMNRARHNLSYTTLQMLYYAIIHPHISYCLIIWGNVCKYLLEKILLLQKRAVRIICNVPYLEHTNPLFIKTGILKMRDLYTIQVCTFMLKNKLNILPPSCCWKYVAIADNIRCYNTRNQPQFEVVRCRTSVRENSISYVGPKIWNSLPLEIQNCFSVGTLTRLLTKLLILNYSL